MRSAPKVERTTFAVAGTLALIFLVFPMLIVALASLDPGQFFTFPPSRISVHWYSEFIKDESWRSSLLLTLTIAGLTAVVSTVIGGLAGIAIARLPSPLRRLMYPLLVAPLTVPVIVLAISFYGVVLELHVVGNLLTFVVANTTLSAPLVALLVLGASLGIDHRRLELASLSCGASPGQTLTRITVPLVAPTATAGGALVFLLALDEVVMSIFLVSPGRTPLAVRMFLQAQTGTTPIVTAASTLLIISSLAILGGLTILRNILTRRGAPATNPVETTALSTVTAVD